MYLDALFYIKDNLDPTLSFRRFFSYYLIIIIMFLKGLVGKEYAGVVVWIVMAIKLLLVLRNLIRL